VSDSESGGCELVIHWYGPEPCGARPSWLVGVGSRASDAQLSCSRHLAGTCRLRLRAEQRSGASLTVTPAPGIRLLIGGEGE
jgi:hypothetical protein